MTTKNHHTATNIIISNSKQIKNFFNNELYFEPIEGGEHNGTPYIRPCFTDNEFDLESWGTICLCVRNLSSDITA